MLKRKKIALTVILDMEMKMRAKNKLFKKFKRRSQKFNSKSSYQKKNKKLKKMQILSNFCNHLL